MPDSRQCEPVLLSLKVVRMGNYCLTGNRGVGVATPITVFEIHDYLNCYDIGPVFCSVILDVIVMTANNNASSMMTAP